MNELLNIPWGKVFSSLVWILGTSIILAAFSYHEFLAFVQKANRIEVFKRNSFKKFLLSGLILVAIGISASVYQIWLAVISGLFAVVLIIWLLKLIKDEKS